MHTPGQWEVTKEQNTAWVGQGILGIAQVFGDNEAEQIANAHLISAAPDLLRELKSVMTWIKNWSPNFIEDDEWRDQEKAVKQAIDKARGKSK